MHFFHAFFHVLFNMVHDQDGIRFSRNTSTAMVEYSQFCTLKTSVLQTCYESLIID